MERWRKIDFFLENKRTAASLRELFCAVRLTPGPFSLTWQTWKPVIMGQRRKYCRSRPTRQSNGTRANKTMPRFRADVIIATGARPQITIDHNWFRPTKMVAKIYRDLGKTHQPLAEGIFDCWFSLNSPENYQKTFLKACLLASATRAVFVPGGPPSLSTEMSDFSNWERYLLTDGSVALELW